MFMLSQNNTSKRKIYFINFDNNKTTTQKTNRKLISDTLEMFYLNSTLNFGIPPVSVLVFQLEFYYKVDRLLTGLTAQQKGTMVFK